MKYSIDKIKIFAYHGIYDEEIKNGQFFYVDFSYTTKIDKVNSDNITDVVDYKCVYDDIVKLFNVKRYNLLENLASFICTEIKLKHPIEHIFIRITKKNILYLDNVNSVSVIHEK